MTVPPNGSGFASAIIARKRVVIFDFDGTLADSIGWFFSVLNNVAERFGFKQTTDAERDALRYRSPFEILAALDIPIWKLPSIARHVRVLATQNIEQIKLFSWVGELLLELRANGMMIAVVSSNSAANVRSVLGSYAELVDHYETGASLFGKCAKFKRTLRTLAVQPPDAITVGDEVRDIDASRQAGIASIGVAWGASHGDALLAAQAALAATPGELRAMLAIGQRETAANSPR